MKTVIWPMLAVLLTLGSACQAQAPTPEPADHSHPAILQTAAEAPGRAAWEALPLLAGRREYLPLLGRAVGSTEALTRSRGLFVAGRLLLPEARVLVRPSLSDSDRTVRMQAAVALATLGDGAGLPGAGVALREGPPWLRFYALQSLWRLNTQRARAALRQSQPYLTPFLADCLRQALAAPPRPLRTTPGVAEPAPGNLAGLWLEVADTFILETDFWWHAGNYGQCIRCQETTVFFDPANVEAFGNIAWLHWSEGRHGQAVSTYRRALAANPRSWEAADALAHYYLGHQQREAAAQYLRLSADLGSPPIKRRALGHVLEGLGRTAEARGVWQEILRLDPGDPIATRQSQRLGGG